MGNFHGNFFEGHPTYLCDENQYNTMGAIVSPQKKQQMLPFIKDNWKAISQREMARRLGVGKTTVNRWSTELGFRHIKHMVNEDFFDNWNEDSAYILGYIFADGNISWNPEKGYQALTITAAEKDVKHLERVRKALSSTKPLLYAEKTKSYRLIANSKKLCQRLMSFGVMPRKSLIVKLPKIPKEYTRHFIRGVIDGDGTVRYLNRKKSPYFEIQISSGSPEFLEKLAETVKKRVGIETKIRNVHGNTFLAQYTCSRGKKLADWIYKDANLFIERKFEHYKTALKAKGGGQP